MEISELVNAKGFMKNYKAIHGWVAYSPPSHRFSNGEHVVICGTWENAKAMLNTLTIKRCACTICIDEP